MRKPLPWVAPLQVGASDYSSLWKRRGARCSPPLFAKGGVVMRLGVRSGRMLRAAFVAVIVVLMSAAARGQDPQQVEKDANEIFNSLMSPFCPGRLIANCPSSQAADLRDQVREQLAGGATKEQVIDGLYAVWGEEVLGGRRGPLSWGVPLGVILMAAALLLFWLWRTSSRVVTSALSPQHLDPAAEQRLEAELSHL